jgi:hypothetical protein
MKDKGKQALVHSKMEAIQFNAEVSENIELSKQLAKRSFKKRNPELCAATRAVKPKKERDESHAETLLLVEQNPHTQIITMYDRKKAELLETQ